MLERPAVIMEPSGGQLTRRELDMQSGKFIAVLRRHGLQPGDPVAWLMNNSLEFVITAWSARAGGFRCLALGTHTSADGTREILEEIQPKAIIISSEYLEDMEAVLESMDSLLLRIVVGVHRPGWAEFGCLLETEAGENIEVTEPGELLLLSGGSTGRSKVIDHGGASPIPPSLAQYFPQPQDVMFISGGIYHTMPLVMIYASLAAQSTLVVLEKFDAEETLRSIQNFGITKMCLVPTMMKRIVDLGPEILSQYDLGCLRLVIHTAAPCHPSLKRAWLELMKAHAPTCETIETYGMSEGFGATLVTDEEWLRHPGTVGRALGCRIVICDEKGNQLPDGEEGLICFIREDGGRMAYRGNEAETNASYITLADGSVAGTARDVGRIVNGYLYITGRAKEMAIIGGANVYPGEAEDVLLLQEPVADVAVFGVPDEVLGEVLEAVVELKPGFIPSDELAAKVIEICRRALHSSHKAPRRIVFMDTLPRYTTGKINKKDLREQVLTGMQ